MICCQWLSWQSNYLRSRRFDSHPLRTFSCFYVSQYIYLYIQVSLFVSSYQNKSSEMLPLRLDGSEIAPIFIIYLFIKRDIVDSKNEFRISINNLNQYYDANSPTKVHLALLISRQAQYLTYGLLKINIVYGCLSNLSNLKYSTEPVCCKTIRSHSCIAHSLTAARQNF